MKRLLMVLICVITLLIISGCLNENIEQVDVYEMESFSSIKQDSLSTFTDSKDVAVFVKAFNTANKEPGIVDVSDPQYKVELGEGSYYFWIKSDKGSIMNVNNTNTIYTLSKNWAKKIYKLLE
ncbi:MAG: hypothetical protein ABWY25_00790 [Paenisporosarcina sp.]